MIMITKITPYLFFNGEAKQALSYYQQIFGGIKSINTRFGDDSTDKDNIEDKKEPVTHAKLETYYFDLYLADVTNEIDFHKGNNIFLTIDFDSEESIDHAYNNLAQEGSILIPIQKAAWNAKYAQIIDKYGIGWDLNFQYDR